DFAMWAEDHLGDADPADAYAQTVAQALDAWRTPGAVQRSATLPSGAPGPRIVDMYLLEVFLHGWDLARATGQEKAPDDSVAQAVEEAWRGKVPDEIRASGRVFGPEVECAPDAPVADRVAAYLGRTP